MELGMKIRRKSILALFLATLIVAALSALIPPAAYAQNCYDPTGQPITCPREKKTKIPTAVPPSRTPTPTATSTATTTPAGILPAGINDSEDGMPSGPNPGQGSPFGLPGGLGMLILVMIIGVLFTGGVFIARFMRRGRNPGPPQVDPGPVGIDPGPVNLNADPGPTQADPGPISLNIDPGPIQTNLNEGTEGPGDLNLDE